VSGLLINQSLSIVTIDRSLACLVGWFIQSSSYTQCPRPAALRTCMPSKATAGPGNMLAGFSGKIFFEFFCLKWRMWVYFIFLSDGEAPKPNFAEPGVYFSLQACVHAQTVRFTAECLLGTEQDIDRRKTGASQQTAISDASEDVIW